MTLIAGNPVLLTQPLYPDDRTRQNDPKSNVYCIGLVFSLHNQHSTANQCKYTTRKSNSETAPEWLTRNWDDRGVNNTTPH